MLLLRGWIIALLLSGLLPIRRLRVLVCGRVASGWITLRGSTALGRIASLRWLLSVVSWLPAWGRGIVLVWRGPSARVIVRHGYVYC